MSGEAGDRILKIEWQNAGFWDDSTTEDYLNFQVWLYEGNNSIEYHYGPNSVENPESFEGEDGYIVQFLPAIDFEDEGGLNATAYVLTGNPNDPTVNEIEPGNEPDEVSTLSGAVPDGTVYRFTPSAMASVEDFAMENIQLYPNPVKTGFRLEFTKGGSKNVNLEVYNVSGQTVKELSGDLTKEINVEDLSAGVYFLNIKKGKAKAVKKLIKID